MVIEKERKRIGLKFLGKVENLEHSSVSSTKRKVDEISDAEEMTETLSPEKKKKKKK